MKYETMVICSTLNQMVNYIAIKEYGIKSIINLTMANTGAPNLKKFNHSNWDNNLESVINEQITHKHFYKNEVKDINTFTEKLENLEESDLGEKPVLWNITGGQRNFVMVITKYVFKKRKDKGDKIIYFEGNEEKFYIYNTDYTENKIDRSEESYPMNIPLAFRLMGIDVKEKESNYDTSEYYKRLIEKDENDKIYEFYKNFYEKYVDQDNQKLLKILIESNKEKPEGELVNDRLEWIIKKIKKIKNCENIIKGKEKIFKKSIQNHNKGKVFGYILEQMAFYKIIDIIKQERLSNNVADINISVKIIASHQDEKVNNHHIDEFDIVLLTKMGKLIIFECKSGAMVGDNAKSTHYSTYRVSGVYGTPVLINPISKDSDRDKYENIKNAENAAKKAGLIICRMGKESNNKENIYSLEHFIKEVLKK